MSDLLMFVVLMVLAVGVMAAAWWATSDEPDADPDEAPPQIDVDLVIHERDALRSRLAASERRSEEIIGSLESVIHRLRASRMTYGENNN